MIRSREQTLLPIICLAFGWVVTAGISLWLLFPLAANTQFSLLPWLPLASLVLSVVRWPWRTAWRWSLDGWGAVWLMLALLVAGCTLLYAEPLLLVVVNVLLALVLCRGVVANNTWPLMGVWLPLILPLVLLFGIDSRLTRIHDRLVYELNLTLMDTLAVPNDGLRTLPTEDISQQYVMDYSGNPWSSWGTVVGLSLLLAALFRRRAVHGIALAISGFLWAFILNVIHTIGPFAARRLIGSAVREPFLSPDAGPYILIGALALLLSADQFLRFALGEVEADDDNVTFAGRIARYWNRMTSRELTSRQGYQLRRAGEQFGLIAVCVGAILLLSALFAVRAGGFYARSFPLVTGEISTTQLHTDRPQFSIGEGKFERLSRGSRLGTRTWRWTVGGALGHAVVGVDESPTAQRDLLHQLRLSDWRIAVVEEFRVSPLADNFEWSLLRLDKALDEAFEVRHRGLLLVAMSRTPPAEQKHSLTLIGRFPNWAGIPLISTRWDGRLQRGSITIWLLADNFQEYTDEEVEAWESLLLEFVESLPTT